MLKNFTLRANYPFGLTTNRLPRLTFVSKRVSKSLKERRWVGPRCTIIWLNRRDRSVKVVIGSSIWTVFRIESQHPKPIVDQPQSPIGTLYVARCNRLRVIPLSQRVAEINKRRAGWLVARAYCENWPTPQNAGGFFIINHGYFVSSSQSVEPAQKNSKDYHKMRFAIELALTVLELTDISFPEESVTM